MRFPAKTPAVVSDAVRRYVRAKWAVTLAPVFVAGAALAGLVIVTFMLVDRFAETGPSWRGVGPWLTGAVVVGTPLVALGLLLVLRVRPLGTAVRLDQAFPENQDRWATSLDLAKRIEMGESVGAAGCVERLFAETQAQTSDAADVWAWVSASNGSLPKPKPRRRPHPSRALSARTSLSVRVSACW